MRAEFARLVSEYEASVVTLSSENQESLVQRLVPACDAAAPITVSFNDFPGVSIRYGRWYLEHLPACGCDYCDDDETELARNLRDCMAAVARGGFSEQFSGDSVLGEFRELGGNPHRWIRRSGDRDQQVGPSPEGVPAPPKQGWAPWSRRDPAA